MPKEGNRSWYNFCAYKEWFNVFEVGRCGTVTAYNLIRRCPQVANWRLLSQINGSPLGFPVTGPPRGAEPSSSYICCYNRKNSLAYKSGVVKSIKFR